MRSQRPVKISLQSWAITDWPEGVYPGDPSRGRYIVRRHRLELLQAGAITRIGRDLVVLGDRYERWLQRKSTEVLNYECPANSHAGGSVTDIRS